MTKQSDAELIAKLEVAAKLVKIGGQYHHYKQKNYRVLELAFLESTTEVCVIYKAEYGAGLTFIRPLSNWLEQVEVDGSLIPRFQLM